MDKYEQRRLALLDLVKNRCGGKTAELAKLVGCSDSYAARMLYPAGKPGKKRIGEDMVDRIVIAFGLEPGALENKAPMPPAPKTAEVPVTQGVAHPPHTQWIGEEEARLLDLYRTTDSEGRERIMDVAELQPRKSVAGLVHNKA